MRAAWMASRVASSPMGGTVVMVCSVRWGGTGRAAGHRGRCGSADAAQSPSGAGLVGRRGGRDERLRDRLGGRPVGEVGAGAVGRGGGAAQPVERLSTTCGETDLVLSGGRLGEGRREDAGRSVGVVLKAMVGRGSPAVREPRGSATPERQYRARVHGPSWGSGIAS